MKFARSIILSALALANSAFAQTAGVEAPQGDLFRAGDGSFYGTNVSGGTENYGGLFRVTPESEVSVLANLSGDAGTPLGAYPRAGLVDDGAGALWGTTAQGGSAGLGTVFKFVPAGNTFTTVLEFNGSNGSAPEAALVSDGAGKLWGTTRTGGTNNLGTVFSIDIATGALTTVVNFTGTSGAAAGSQPKAALVRDSSGVFWGTTAAGGTGGLGTLFSIDPANSNAFTTRVIFTGTNGVALGSSPEAALIVDGSGKLWGTTSSGGTSDLGSVFQFDPGTGTLTTIVNFTGTNGSAPKAALRADGVLLWGTTRTGGTADLGTIFTITTPGNTHAVVASFTGTTGAVRGAYPMAALVPGAAGELWGVASQGGRDDRGTIFKVLTATGAVQLVAEPEFGPVLPTSTVLPPPATILTGAAGTPITLTGTAKDNIELLSVIVSINGGPFLPATLIAPLVPGQPFKWQIDVVPENGVNVVIIKSVDNGGNPAKPRILVFNYTITRPELVGAYSGLFTAEPTSTTPLLHSGSVALKVNSKGRFTGKLTLGGRALPIVLKGSIGNSGAARLGKTGTTSLPIPRIGLPPLLLSLNFDVAAPVSGTMTGTLREGATTVAQFDGSLAPAYKPVINPVPLTVADPATDKGVYTFLLAARTPTAQGLPADVFPQGDGFGRVTISPKGRVKVVGKLADGTPFSSAGALRQEPSFSCFANLYTAKGAISGRIFFVETINVSDAFADVQWFRPAIATAPAYRNGWLTGIGVDFVGSKYVSPLITGATPLGNVPSTGTANGLVKLRDGNLPGELSNLIGIPVAGASTVLGAPPMGTAATGLKTTLLGTGLITGSFTHPASALPTLFGGAVLQKTQTGGGYFLAAPVGGAIGDPKQSGHVELSAQ